MKRITLIILIIGSLTTGLFAQTQNFDYNDLKSSFKSFADAVAPVLPFNAAVGLNWSDAYIGQLLAVPPHFGVGITAGVTTIPFSSMDAVFTKFSIALPPGFDFIEKYGLPFPAYTADVRIGGFILPFDIGLKFGYLPPDVFKELPFKANYLFFGGDIRFAILKERFLLPAVSIGAGYSFLKGGVGVPGLLGGNIALTNFEVTNPIDNTTTTYDLSLQDPSLNFDWQTQVFDLKLQASKNLFIITPYAGLGASYGISSAGGGLTTKLLLNGVEITPEQIQEIEAAFKLAGEPVPDLSAGGIIVSNSVQGLSVRAYGGVSLNLLILKLDFTGMYNFTGNNYGATVNLRFQL
ncbi:MAG: hypothetical protein GXP33_05515 [Spirochaetes bacterium]|nr:hypothetical protein [Spirochaetota bacterium]